MGHLVQVYTTHRNLPKKNLLKENKGNLDNNLNNNLEYKNISNINELFKKENFVDVLVIVKDLPTLLLDIPCKVRLFLTADGANEISTFGIGDKRYINRIDCLLGMSAWHIDTLCKTSGFLMEKCEVLGNAIDLSNYSGVEKRERKRLIFTAAPYKGLELTIRLIKELREKDADIEFHSFSGFNIYDGEAPFKSDIAKEYKKVNAELEKIQGVFIHGNILQKDLAREYMKSALLIYPCTWFETGARTLLEAQAAGCPVVASRIGATEEIVGSGGFIISEKLGSEKFYEKFKLAIIEILNNDELWSKMSLSGKMNVKNNFSDETVAKRFEKLLLKRL
ncbi:MAG: glycosyltransferase family 4 protein [Bdellovibrionota bacterium]